LRTGRATASDRRPRWNRWNRWIRWGRWGRPSERVVDVALGALPGGPGLDAEPPQPHEPGRVLVAEAVVRVVGGQLVVVERVLAPATGDLAGAGRQVEPHVARH